MQSIKAVIGYPVTRKKVQIPLETEYKVVKWTVEQISNVVQINKLPRYTLDFLENNTVRKRHRVFVLQEPIQIRVTVF